MFRRDLIRNVNGLVNILRENDITVYGFLALWAARWFEKNQGMTTLLAEQAGQRVALASVLIFLFTGLFLLLNVDEEKALQQSNDYSLENGNAV